jgi:hypothetical protein
MQLLFRSILFAAFLTLTIISNAVVWKVGPLKTYIKPSQVSGLVNNGDTVDIDVAVYTADVCYWNKNNLLLRGIGGGYAHLNANNTSYGQKAIWVIGGINTTVQYIEFSNCHDVVGASKNWAGIRQEGANLTVQHCYFHNNDDGILANAVNPSKILIEYTEFGYCGWGDGFSHNLYINAIDTLVFRYNYSHHADIGHDLKSRAWINYILYNRFSDEATGTASRNIDIPQGGIAVVMGNVIEHGVNAQNSNAVGYKLEAPVNPTPHNFYLINNTIVSNRSTAVFVSLGAGTNLYKGYNNIFAGTGTLLSGTTTVLDTVRNKFYPTISSAGFVNAGTYDYHLTGSSSAINQGTTCGVASNGFVLNSVLEYLHPYNFTNRVNVGAIDIGAYEFTPAAGIENILQQANVEVHLAYSILTIASLDRISLLKIYDMNGKIIFDQRSVGEGTAIDVSSFPNGIYIIKAETDNGKVFVKKMKF